MLKASNEEDGATSKVRPMSTEVPSPSSGRRTRGPHYSSRVTLAV